MLNQCRRTCGFCGRTIFWTAYFCITLEISTYCITLHFNILYYCIISLHGISYHRWMKRTILSKCSFKCLMTFPWISFSQARTTHVAPSHALLMKDALSTHTELPNVFAKMLAGKEMTWLRLSVEEMALNIQIYVHWKWKAAKALK